MLTPKARCLQGTSCIIEKIPFYLRSNKIDRSEYYFRDKGHYCEEYPLKRNKEHYFKINQTVYHKIFGQGVIKYIHPSKNLVVDFNGDIKALSYKVITENELLKPYNKF